MFILGELFLQNQVSFSSLPQFKFLFSHQFDSFYASLVFFFREVSKPERFSGDNIIYKPMGENAPDMVYMGSLTNFDLSYAWTQDKCVPLVREITFENGEV